MMLFRDTMNQKNLLAVFLLLLTMGAFADQENPPTNQDQPKKQEPTDHEKYVFETMFAAMRKGSLPESEATAEYIYDNAPEALKDYVNLINKMFDENKYDKSTKFLLPNRILLVGPPGCGKSTLAAIVAYKLKRDCYFVLMPVLGNEYKNSEIANLARFFEIAEKSKRKCVIILDELNVFVERKSNIMGEDIGCGSALWLLLDKYVNNPNILVIGTANDVTKLPPQLKDRFEGNIVEIKKSSWNDRLRIIEHYLEKHSDLCSFAYLRKLAKKTDGFSPRQLELLIKAAYQEVFLAGLPLSFLREENLESAYQKFVLSSDVLQSKRWFNIKEWLKENSLVIQTVASSVNLACVLVSICYVAVTGKVAGRTV